VGLLTSFSTLGHSVDGVVSILPREADFKGVLDDFGFVVDSIAFDLDNSSVLNLSSAVCLELVRDAEGAAVVEDTSDVEDVVSVPVFVFNVSVVVLVFGVSVTVLVFGTYVLVDVVFPGVVLE